ncbi:integrase [Vibrio sp. HA2012]|uniref:tyrosine-type recombinase/integrase n=1 Tax=Vibrio sp. HA2012 TaxID=1971595 RepID=UPI000C2C745B|nr:site-specific integrase [Vibrio sp. HA2012]PJC86017.1 integrase [Vibrio sp. HA2012]
MDTAINFTKKALQQIPIPDKRVRYRDSGGSHSVRGLGLEVYTSGQKTFRYEQKVKGRNIKVTLGTFPELTVEQARKLAQENAQKISQGINPNEEKQKEREKQKQAQSFDDLFEQYVALVRIDIKSGTRRESSLKGFEARYRIHLKPLIGKKKAEDFTKADGRKLLKQILADKGYAIHNHCLTLLKSMFNRAELEFNPFADGKKVDESVHRRERILSPDELQRLFAALDEEEDIYRDCVLMLLLTGQRKSCVLSMRWNEINTTNETWIIPISKIKTKKPHVVPLSGEVMRILNRRSVDAEIGEEFVFPSNRSKGGYITDKSGKGGFWHRILVRAGLHDPDSKDNNVRVHDLRRTIASYQVQGGGSLQATSKLLGHASVGITADVYAHLSVDNVRADLERTTAQMLGYGYKENSKVDDIKEQLMSLTLEEQAEILIFLQGMTKAEVA